MATRCAGIQDKWEYRNRAVSLSQKIHYKDEHVMSFQEYTTKWQKVFHLYYLDGEELSEGLKVACFLDGLKAEDGSTASISKSAIFSDPVYSEDLNKVISRLSMDIAGNKANRRSGNYSKNGNNGKKMKYSVYEVGIDGSKPPSKPSRNPSGVDVSDPTKWFEKEDFAKLSPEWKKYCNHMRYEAKKKKSLKAEDNDTNEKKVDKNNRSNRNKRNNKYIKEVVAKQTAKLEAKFEQKISSASSVSSYQSSRQNNGVPFISSIQTGERKISSVQRTNTTNVGESAALELDSHADT